MIDLRFIVHWMPLLTLAALVLTMSIRMILHRRGGGWIPFLPAILPGIPTFVFLMWAIAYSDPPSVWFYLMSIATLATLLFGLVFELMTASTGRRIRNQANLSPAATRTLPHEGPPRSIGAAAVFLILLIAAAVLGNLIAEGTIALVGTEHDDSLFEFRFHIVSGLSAVVAFIVVEATVKDRAITALVFALLIGFLANILSISRSPMEVIGVIALPSTMVLSFMKRPSSYILAMVVGFLGGVVFTGFPL
ncbi:MAG: hypothetical protein WC509_04410 [Candidatus Izemoplasmatales bacterium]